MTIAEEDHENKDITYEQIRGERIFMSPEKGQADIVREGAAAYRAKRQGEYTLEDYYALPEDYRAELIDGALFKMEAPTPMHQLLVTELWGELRSYIRDKRGLCIPVASPVDVQLDRDDKTMVQPDVLIVCDRGKIIRRCVYGAPEFIVEILSPSTKQKDSYIKLQKYMSAGVKEYWLVDPEKKRVVVYDFAHDEGPVIYGFDAKVPVGLFDGDCEIDFPAIYKYVEFLYGTEE